MENTNMNRNIVSKYLKFFGLDNLKQVIYIMRTAEDEYPKNKHPNWTDYVRDGIKLNYKGVYWSICPSTIEELEYQIKNYPKHY